MGRRRVIAFLTNNGGLGHDYQAGLRRGVELACIEHDIDLWVYAGRSDWSACSSQREVYRLMDPDHVDGIVVASGCFLSDGALSYILEIVRTTCPDVPACAVSGFCDGMANVLMNSARGAEQLVDHLVREHGRRRVAYVAGPEGHPEAEERLAATREALARVGLELPDTSVSRGEFSRMSGREIVRGLVERGVEFDAVVAASDDLALGALDFLGAQGLRCPEAISVVGFDDSPNAGLAQPGLTTVRQPLARAGAWAVAHLIDTWAGRAPPRSATFDTELVVRASCGCSPTDATRAGSGPDLSRSDRDRLVDQLAYVFDDDRARRDWAERLLEAIGRDRGGDTGATARAFDGMIRTLPDSRIPAHELQRIITTLRGTPKDLGDMCVEGAFHAARAVVGGHAYSRAGEETLRNEDLVVRLRVGWERLATSLSFPALKSALTRELPRFEIRNALVALYAQDDPDTLVPLVCLGEGQAADEGLTAYQAPRLIPPGAFDSDRRLSFTVLPLTFESEQLGVAVFEFPVRTEVYLLLREQIGSAIKTVRQHEEILEKERLHGLAHQEKRATVERLRSLSILAGGVAHDLNNVLGPMLALPDVIREDLETGGGAPPAVSEDLETIHQAAERATQTIRDLLALGRSGQMPSTAVELNELLESERRTFLHLRETGGRVTLHIEKNQEPLVIRASKPQLVRAVSNLVLNAIDAIVETGEVSIRVRRVVLSERIEGVEIIDPGRYAVLEVADTGAGIPEEHLPRVLEPFFSAKRRSSGAGSGLGLAIVHRIVQDSRGYIEIESEVGRGSTFRLYFPLAEGLRPSSSPLAARAVGGRERILIVDDEPFQVRTARRLLEQLGYTVVTARSGEEALLLVPSGPAASGYDLVIVDMVMPEGMNGMAVVEELRRRTPSQKVMIASGYAPQELATRCTERGLAWIAKPYTLAGLAEAVRSAFDAPPAPR